MLSASYSQPVLNINADFTYLNNLPTVKAEKATNNKMMNAAISKILKTKFVT